MILASHGIIGSQISIAPVATAATGVGSTSFTANWNAYSGAVVYLLDVSTSPTFATFIYEDQQVNAPTTSYVVIGLTANTTYYYRVRASTEALTDPDAQAFFDRVTAAGGTLSATEQSAILTLVADLKANSLWTPMKAIYPMVGASAAACAQNLKSSSFTGSFSSGWTFASIGVTPATAFMNTNLNTLSELTQTSTHLSIYIRNNSNSGQPYDMGNATTAGMIVNPTYIISRYSTDVNYLGIADSSYGTSSANTDSRGFWCGGTNGSLAQVLYRNGTSFSTGTTTVGTFANNNLFLGAANNGGTASFFTDKQYAFCSIGDGLSATQASNYYTAVQAFQTTLSRQV